MVLIAKALGGPRTRQIERTVGVSIAWTRTRPVACWFAVGVRLCWFLVPDDVPAFASKKPNIQITANIQERFCETETGFAFWTNRGRCCNQRLAWLRSNAFIHLQPPVATTLPIEPTTPPYKRFLTRRNHMRASAENLKVNTLLRKPSLIFITIAQRTALRSPSEMRSAAVH